MAIKPRALRTGDTIGIVTLGSPLPAETINARLAHLRSMGFQTVLGRHVYTSTGFLAGPPEERAADLMNMFRDTRVRMILPVRGGVGVEGILPHLDFDVIRRNPKLISGYSDVTILLNVLYQFSGFVTLHHLLLIDFRPDTPDFNIEQFFTAVTSTAAPRPIVNPPGVPLQGRVPGNVTGPLVGGNLTSLIGSLGTPYEIDTRGAILMLEETHEPVNTVYRYLEQLRLAGKFRDCAGIVMGQCTNCPPAYGTTYEDLINGYMVPLGKPLLTNLSSGHGPLKAAVPIGVRVNLNADANQLTMLEPIVSPP